MKRFSTLLLFCFFAKSLAQNSQNFNGVQKDEETRPCSKEDVNCIRKFFAEHSHCSPVQEYEKENEFHKKIQRQRSMSYLTAINATATLDFVTYNLNAKVDDFFIDIENDKVVLVVTFENLKIKSDYASIRFHRRSKEPVITKGTFYADHGPIVVTATIPTVNNIKLKDSISFAFLTEPLPRVLEVSPSLFRSRDPEVKLASVEFFKKVRALTLEFFSTEAAFIFTNFVQHYICDFGLQIL